MVEYPEGWTFWWKKYDPLISVICLEVDWARAIKVGHEEGTFIILDIYTPYESCQNENEYLISQAFISSFIKESEFTCMFILGDLNADISDDGSLFDT